MVGRGNQGDETEHGKVRKLGDLNEQLVYGSSCIELAAESAGLLQHFVIDDSYNMCFSASDIDTPQCFCIDMGIDRNCTLAVNTDYMIICTKLQSIKQY
jgi:hypothetical protein